MTIWCWISLLGWGGLLMLAGHFAHKAEQLEADRDSWRNVYSDSARQNLEYQKTIRDLESTIAQSEEAMQEYDRVFEGISKLLDRREDRT